jgi:hypothetical protein
MLPSNTLIKLNSGPNDLLDSLIPSSFLKYCQQDETSPSFKDMLYILNKEFNKLITIERTHFGPIAISNNTTAKSTTLKGIFSHD